MNIDFAKYEKLIASFRGEVNAAHFELKFAQLTQKMTKTEKFLLKMELKRLASACTRSIDLRGLVNGDCKLFEYCGQSHFLDDIAVRVFEENVEKYQGYTFGVYEAVKNTENNFRVIYQKEQQHVENIAVKASIGEQAQTKIDKTQYPVNSFSCNQRHNRIDERMNFATALTIVLGDNNRKLASSIDISVTGIKFRLNSKEILHIGQEIGVIFSGINHDFQEVKDEVFIYQIRSIYSDDTTRLVGCQRLNDIEEDTLKVFLFDYIKENKRRYKINLENTIAALESRIFEQYVLPKINELPIFFEKFDNTVMPRYVLTTHNNQAVFQYWQDESHHSTLSFLVNNERLTRLMTRYREGKSLLVYSFVHQHQGKNFFYTVDDVQLSQKNDYSPEFLAFAAKKVSFTVTKLTYFNLDKSCTYSPFILSNSEEIEKNSINLPPSGEVMDCINAIPFCVVAVDITNKISIEAYQKFSNNQIDVNTFKTFGHKRCKNTFIVDELAVTYKNLRQEPRFIYKTPVLIEFNEREWQASSIDFSISGLKILLSASEEFCTGDIVYITFPNLQKITSSYDLTRIAYEVVNTNKSKNIINFRVYVKAHQHVGRSFFKLLIEKNKDKLTADEYSLLVPGLAESLRTYYAQCMNIPTLIVQRSGRRYKVEVLVNNDQDNRFLKKLRTLSDRKSLYNFYPLLTKLYKDNFLDSCLKSLTINAEPIKVVVYIAFNHNIVHVNKDVNIKLEHELSTLAIRENFIKQAIEQGDFFCFQLSISRTNPPDLTYLSSELSYISLYAIHRSKQIEQEILSVVAAIQCIDITNEVLYSHKL